jgi:thiamine monophosphate kinase
MGMKEGDLLLINKKFGLTSVGFDILLKRNENPNNFEKYNRSIMSVLEPTVVGIEARFLSEKGLSTASIDSSDGLIKSLRDLMLSNKGLGFEVIIDKNLIDNEAFEYSNENYISLNDLICKGGEEFTHLFTIEPKNYDEVIKLVESEGGSLFQVGKVIAKENIVFIEGNKKTEIKDKGYVHFI